MAEISGYDGEGRQSIGGELDLEVQVAVGHRHRPAPKQRLNPCRLAAALAEAPVGFSSHRRHVRPAGNAPDGPATTLYHP